MRLALLLFVLGAQLAPAADPIARFPTPAKPAPVPAPAPPPQAPPGPDKLPADKLYVVDADDPVLLVTSPRGVVKVTRDAGPIKIRGKFVDGQGYETRTYSGKAVYTLEAVGGGLVEVIVSPAGNTDEEAVVRKTLDVAGPDVKPSPKPDDPKPDDPKPAPKDPAPIPAPGFRALILYESADAAKVPPAQQLIMYGKPTRELLDRVCVAGPDGKTKEWRIYDKDVDTARVDPLWRAAVQRGVQKATTLPWLILSNGETGYEGPLSAGPEAFRALVGQYVKE